MLSLNISQSRIKFFGRARPLCGGPVRRESGRLLPADEGVRREGFLMAQWGLAKNGRTTPRLYARTPALQPNNVILVLRTPLSGPFLECGPFFGMKRTVVANLLMEMRCLPPPPPPPGPRSHNLRSDAISLRRTLGSTIRPLSPSRAGLHRPRRRWLQESRPTPIFNVLPRSPGG
jgi:hypothetical protein